MTNTKEKTKNIGVDVKAPEKECNDVKCPFHGHTKLRGRTFIGNVISDKAHKTVTVEWGGKRIIQKYGRYEKIRTRIKAHNPDCINAKEGDVVTIMESRPLSKTKNFIVIKKEKGEVKIHGEDLTAKEEKPKEKAVEKKETKESKKSEKKSKIPQEEEVKE